MADKITVYMVPETRKTGVYYCTNIHEARWMASVRLYEEADSIRLYSAEMDVDEKTLISALLGWRPTFRETKEVFVKNRVDAPALRKAFFDSVKLLEGHE